jgi:hypothetical protein
MILQKFRHRRPGYPCSSLTNDGLLQHRTTFVAPQRTELEELAALDEAAQDRIDGLVTMDHEATDIGITVGYAHRPASF